MFYLIQIVVLAVVAGLCFWLPCRQGKKQLGIAVSLPVVLLAALLLFAEWGYFAVFLLAPVLLFCFVFISYWALVNLRLKKSARVAAVVLSMLFLLPFIAIALEDYLFFKKDATAFLKVDGIVLLDDFSIRSNRITGLTDMYQKFELEISAADKARIVRQLKSSASFVGSVPESYYLPSRIENRLTPKIIVDYQLQDNYVRETYEKQREGFVSDHDIITISGKNNVLIFERFNE